MESGTYDESYPYIFDAVLQILSKLGLHKESVNKKDGKIVVSKGVSLRSWGERITIQVTKEDSKTKVTVSSVPEAQLFDWGKSRENERRIMLELNTLSRRR